MKINLIPIKKIDSYKTEEIVHNLQVEDDESYCVENNIAVHNSMCKTRKMTGVGYGTLSCVIECSQTAHGLKNGPKKLGLICSDGGISSPGSACKAFGGGADFLMLGNYFSGVSETSDVAEWTYNDDGTLKSMKMYGMSSHLAQEIHGEGKKPYRASEGIVTEVSYKGLVDEVIQELLGGLRSCGTYLGADCIKDFSKCAKFIRINK